MSRRRSSPYKALTPSHDSRWLIAHDPVGRVVAWRSLAPNTNLLGAMLSTLEQMHSMGWTIEQKDPEHLERFGNSFCHRQGRRLEVGIFPTFPQSRDYSPLPPESSVEQWYHALL